MQAKYYQGLPSFHQWSFSIYILMILSIQLSAFYFLSTFLTEKRTKRKVSQKRNPAIRAGFFYAQVWLFR